MRSFAPKKIASPAEVFAVYSIPVRDRRSKARLARERRPGPPRPSDGRGVRGEGGKDRPSRARRSTAPRPSDGRGIGGEGKDRLSRERRSWNMSRIRGKDTTPEKRVRSLLHRLGFRFRLHVRIPVTLSASTGEAPPSPLRKGRGAGGEVLRCRTPRAVSVDILLPKYKTAIFVHGCFWHRHRGCKNCTTPTHRREWWLKKLEGNTARDKVHQAAVKKLGWRSIVVWECQTEDPESLKKMAVRLSEMLRQGSLSRRPRLHASGACSAAARQLPVVRQSRPSPRRSRRASQRPRLASRHGKPHRPGTSQDNNRRTTGLPRSSAQTSNTDPGVS